jgi:hypothetical protein
MTRPCFFASQVAALIGRHKYKTREAALLEVVRPTSLGINAAAYNANVRKAFSALSRESTALTQVAELSAVVDRASADKELGARPEELAALAASAQVSAAALDGSAKRARAAAKEAQTEAAALIASADSTALQAAAAARAEVIRASLPAELAPLAIEAAEAEAQGTATAEQKVLAETVAQKAPAAQAAAHRAKTATHARIVRSAEQKVRQYTTLTQAAVEKEDQGAELMALAQKPEVFKKVVEQAVQKKRGRDEEDAVLDCAAVRHCAPIVSRNEETARLEMADFVIVGRCDGILEDGGGIVEVKKRRNWFGRPPEYDIVQLRVYMRLFNLPRGILIEEQLNGDKRRETVVEHCEEEWERICDALSLCAKELCEAKVPTICAWADSVLNNP